MIIKENGIKNIEWPHAITEDTISGDLYKEIEDAFNSWEPGDKVSDEIVGYSALIFFPDVSKWNGVVNSIWNQTQDSPSYNRNAKDYLVVLELSIQRPGKSYEYHIDVDRKQFTGVCYWQGENGTVLKSGNNEIEIKFKHNRCLWFSNVRPEMWGEDVQNMINPIMPWHRYYNNSKDYRYTVNINYTPQKEVVKFLTEKQKQFNYYMSNKKPLWVPMAR